MKIAVIGAGIIGVTTAHALCADGHRVTVFERHGSVAAEASFASAGLMGGHRPWPTRLRRPVSGLLPWLWQRSRAGKPPAARAHRLQLQRLLAFSRERLHAIVHEFKLEHEQSKGLLMLLRTPRGLQRLQRAAIALDDSGGVFQPLDSAACHAIEPGLNAETPLHAGIYLPGEEVGNCREFAHLLRQATQRLGAHFRLHTEVQRIVAGASPQLVHLHAPSSREAPTHAASAFAAHDMKDTQPMSMEPVTEGFDAVVVCAAMGSASLLRPLGLALPMQAIHGYSITAPLRQHEGHPDLGPRSAVMDVERGIVMSRLGTRVRIAGGAEIGGSATRLYPDALGPLYASLHDWFPGSARLTRAQRWKGARPTLPDGPPVLGASGIDGVWLNLGHGDHGWASACGSARLLADAIAGRPAAIDIDGFGVDRLRH